MSLRLIRQIFLKDLQRLWWVILLTLLLLGRLEHFDSWRSTVLPDSEEGWLNILLPLAWSLLIALAVFEDSAAAESPFWVTLPCRWQPILAAKTLFTLAFIHVPYFIACAMILQARGLGVSGNIPGLLLRQLFLSAFTIPAIALATVVRNVTQYMSVAIVLATIVGTLPMGGDPFPDADVLQGLREAILFTMTAAAGMWIVFAQYRHRLLTRPRAVGIVAIAIATILWWFPAERFDGLGAALSPPPAGLSSAGIELAGGTADREYIRGNISGIFVPISASAPPPGYVAGFRQSSLMIREADGRTENASMRSWQMNYMGNLRSLTADLTSTGRGTLPNKQIIAMDEATLTRLRAAPITIQGSALVTYHRDAEQTWIGLNQRAQIPGLGICRSEIVGEYPQNETLRVNCESAGALPMVHVTLFDPVGNREWKHDLNTFRYVPNYAGRTWLSPISRGQADFPVSDEEHYAVPAGKWQAPREALPTAKLGITPSVPQGSALIHYELPNVRLEPDKGR